MTNLRELLAFNMKEYRHSLKLSQSKLAEKAGTSTHYIGMIEVCKKFPTPEMLERIASALKIDSPELFSTRHYLAKPELHDKVIAAIDDIITYRMQELGIENYVAERQPEKDTKTNP
jgi:transcriptional regulator with XRE-family HTH domain